MLMLDDYRTRKIPKEIRKFIEEIPENGTVKVHTWQTDEPDDVAVKCHIIKHGEKLEFVILQRKSDEVRLTVYEWDYLNEPEKWRHFFVLNNMPRVEKINGDEAYGA